MTPEQIEQVDRLAAEAMSLPAEQWPEFVRSRCGGDNTVLDEVLALLRHAEKAEREGLMEHPAAPPGDSMNVQGQGTPPSAPDHGIGRYIGRFKVLSILGEGGMGIVYLAEQREPVRRRVAMKVIKPGMDSKAVIARFEAERQALAMMDHPNIAKIFDAGTTPDGRPYFVMEYVKGEPITTYADRHLLTTRERLELFIQVCRAVQHAHKKDVIHRDLKPTNVLVAVSGEAPMPKVIDFGVAKATDHVLTTQTLYTQQGQLIGTPEYMSPEQAEMGAIDIDTRTDVYSLGVMLYELLVGALPFEPTSLRQAGLMEIQRIIREQEPPRPSARLTDLGDNSSLAARKRKSDPGSLTRQLRGDLDWITMKAMEKDRTRRYATASNLAEHLRLHLNDEPVPVGPPGALYRIGKLVKRNKTGATAVAVVVLTIAVALGGAFHSRRQQLDSRKQQEVERLCNDGMRHTEAGHWKEARTRLLAALELDPRHVKTLSSLARLNCRQSNAAEAPLEREGLLAEAEEMCRRALEIAPEDFDAAHRLGGIFKMQGRYLAAVRQLQRAIDVPHSPERRVYALVDIATIHALMGEFEQAERSFEMATALAGEVHTADQIPYAAQAWRNQASLRFALRREGAADLIGKAIARNPKDWASHAIRARILLSSGDPKYAREARKDAEFADSNASRDYEKARAKRIHAMVCLRLGEFERAIECAEKAEELGDMASVNRCVLALAESKLGHAEKARDLLQQAIDARPDELRESDACRVTAEAGVLWIDTAAELDALIEDVRAAMAD